MFWFVLLFIFWTRINILIIRVILRVGWSHFHNSGSAVDNAFPLAKQRRTNHSFWRVGFTTIGDNFCWALGSHHCLRRIIILLIILIKQNFGCSPTLLSPLEAHIRFRVWYQRLNQTCCLSGIVVPVLRMRHKHDLSHSALLGVIAFPNEIKFYWSLVFHLWSEFISVRYTCFSFPWIEDRVGFK